MMKIAPGRRAVVTRIRVKGSIMVNNSLRVEVQGRVQVAFRVHARVQRMCSTLTVIVHGNLAFATLSLSVTVT